MILRFPNNEDLSDLFSCSICTLQEENGYQRMEAVVLDGTALGILVCLPSFQRITCTVPIAKRITVERYITKTLKKRLFVGSIFVSSKTKNESDEFTVSLKEKFREAE